MCMCEDRLNALAHPYINTDADVHRPTMHGLLKNLRRLIDVSRLCKLLYTENCRLCNFPVLHKTKTKSLATITKLPFTKSATAVLTSPCWILLIFANRKESSGITQQYHSLSTAEVEDVKPKNRRLQEVVNNSTERYFTTMLIKYITNTCTITGLILPSTL